MVPAPAADAAATVTGGTAAGEIFGITGSLRGAGSFIGVGSLMGAGSLFGAMVSDTGYDDSISADALICDGASATGETALRGVPSTGQKLNRSANCSLQVSQNFILTTSLSRWGSNTELKLAFMLVIC